MFRENILSKNELRYETFPINRKQKKLGIVRKRLILSCACRKSNYNNCVQSTKSAFLTERSGEAITFPSN